MDVKTAEIRYGQWVQVIQDWSNSGLTKRDYCREKGIDEKHSTTTNAEFTVSLLCR